MMHVVAFEPGPIWSMIEPLALRDAFDHVHQDDIAQFFGREVNGAVSADIASATTVIFLRIKQYSTAVARVLPRERSVFSRN